MVRILCWTRNAMEEVLPERPEVQSLQKDQAGKCQISEHGLE